MTVQDDAKTDFADRVNRIRAGGQGTNRTLYVGMDETLPLPQRRSAGRNHRAGPLRAVALGGLLLGLGLCAAALLAAAGVIAPG